MRPAARTMLEALERVWRSGREDRLTEVFAHTLTVVPELAAWLVSSVASAPPPRAGGPFEVYTQGALAGEGRPDLHLYYEDEAGRRCLLLSEHKLEAGLTAYQRTGYRGWVERDGLLLIGSNLGRLGEAAAAFDALLSWLMVGEAVDALGDGMAGRSWRDVATAPEANSRLRALHELMTLLENYDLGEGGVEPLNEGLIGAYERIDNARRGLKSFLDLVGHNESLERFGARGMSSFENDTTWAYGFDVDWPLLEGIDKDYGSEIVITPSAQWLTDIRGPVLYAGFYFAISDGRLPGVFRDSPALAAGLRGAVAAPQNRNLGKCAYFIALSEIVSRSQKLSDQVEFAARWAHDAFERLATTTA